MHFGKHVGYIFSSIHVFLLCNSVTIRQVKLAIIFAQFKSLFSFFFRSTHQRVLLVAPVGEVKEPTRPVPDKSSKNRPNSSNDRRNTKENNNSNNKPLKDSLTQ